jgi:hypothetical protein
LALAEALGRQMGLQFVIGGAHQLFLGMDEVNGLATALDAQIVKRKASTHQENTGVRKLTVEKSAGVDDIRVSPMYIGLLDDIDEGDEDTLVLTHGGSEYSLLVTRRGSFWFRSHTPRELIDAVLGTAEGIFGL